MSQIKNAFSSLTFLQVTIEMEHISGETHYIPPPLAKGEILNGIAGFLEKDIVKKRPRALDIYGPYKNQEELEIDILGGPKSARVPLTARSERKASNSTFGTETESEGEDESADKPVEEVNVAFDVQRLPVAYGTKTTEMLIESLFNPVKITQKGEETPFTYYEPPSPSSPSQSPGITPRVGNAGYRPTRIAAAGHDRDATIGRRQGSMSHEEAASLYSTSSSSASVRTTTSSSSHSAGRSRDSGPNSLVQSMVSDSSHGFVTINAKAAPEGRVVVEHLNATDEPASMGGVRGWWRRNVARPGTPTTRTHA